MNGVGEQIPLSRPPVQFRQSCWRDVVHFAFPPAHLSLPSPHDHIFAFQSMQSGIEGSLFEFQRIVATPFDLACDGVAVQGRVLQNREHKRRRIPFKQFFVTVHSHSPGNALDQSIHRNPMYVKAETLNSRFQKEKPGRIEKNAQKRSSIRFFFCFDYESIL